MGVTRDNLELGKGLGNCAASFRVLGGDCGARLDPVGSFLGGTGEVAGCCGQVRESALQSCQQGAALVMQMGEFTHWELVALSVTPHAWSVWSNCPCHGSSGDIQSGVIVIGAVLGALRDTE